MDSLAGRFNAYFRAERVVSQEQARDAHRLRYSVYCLEHGYEDPLRFQDKLEKDEFDAGSVHGLVRHRVSGQPVGVVRLILPDRSDLNRSFPIEDRFGRLFDNRALGRFRFPRNQIAEVSRFAISTRLLQSLDSSPQSLAGPCPPSFSDPDILPFNQVLPCVSYGLIAMLFSLSVQHKINHWYAVMEPSLHRLLKRSGIEFHKIGPLMDFHGKRQPMLANVDELLDKIYRKNREFYYFIDELGGIAPEQDQVDKVKAFQPVLTLDPAVQTATAL